MRTKYLSELENTPKNYCRYVDDIFILVRDENKIISLEIKMEENSILKFTCEIGNSKIAFLDVDVSANRDILITKVYKKPTL